MIVYYKYAGLVANIAVAGNLLMLLALLSAFGATLTLPGLAGVGLTVGMAVDGNIIIYERIREELRAGRSARSAVEAGFDRALWTVLDANITTLIAGAVLFQFGTGPIRGFAVTLSVGIVTTVLTNLFLSRWLLEAWVQRRGVRSLPI
jgi:protein-export membrane protein SecD